MDWNKGDEVEYTRLTVPIETIRIASLSDTYLAWIKKFSMSDEFMRKCVNNGVPLRTSSALARLAGRLAPVARELLGSIALIVAVTLTGWSLGT